MIQRNRKFVSLERRTVFVEDTASAKKRGFSEEKKIYALTKCKFMEKENVSVKKNHVRAMFFNCKENSTLRSFK